MSSLIFVTVRAAEQMRDEGIRFGMFKVGQAACSLLAIVALFALGQGVLLDSTALVVVGGVSTVGLVAGAYLCSRRLNYPQSVHVSLEELEMMHDHGVSIEMIERVVDSCLVGTVSEWQAGRTAEALLARLRAAR